MNMMMMKKDLTLDGFMEAVADDQKGKEDFIIKPSSVNMLTNGNLLLLNDNEKNTELTMTDWAFKQTLSKLQAKGFPQYGAYLKEIGQHTKLAELFEFHKNQLIQKREDTRQRDWLIRSKQGKATALLTDLYAVIDNDFVAEQIYNTFKDKDITIEATSLDTEYMNVRIVLNNTGLEASSNDKIFAGVHIKNSEVGASSVVVHPMVWREVCSNGLIAVEHSGAKYRQIHLAKDKEEKLDRIVASIPKVIAQAESTLTQFIASKKERVDEKQVKEVIETIGLKGRMTKKHIDTVLEAYQVEPEPTKYGIINAFTRASKPYNFERRLELEAHAGSLLNKKIA